MTRTCSISRALLASGASLLTLLTTPALAQEVQTPQETAAETDPGEIVVTARRREETLLDVPIAVTAFSGAQLTASGAIDVTDIAAVTPNVTLEVSRGSNSTLSAFIRGVGQQDPVGGFEGGVGLYLDDVYLNRPQAAVLDIYDVERVEVLRGPQGTLYGRNTIGGAVKYVTRRLGAEPTLVARGTYGTFDQIDGVLSASAPIGDTGFRLGGAVARLTRDGFGTNLTTGDENYNKDIWAARGTLQYETTGAFFRLSGDYTLDKSNPRGGHRLIPGLVSGTPILRDVFDSRGNLVTPEQRVEAYGGALFAELEPADWLTFRSITGYRKDDTATPIDFDALNAVQVDVPSLYNNEQFSQEVQLLVNTGGLNLLLGGYYLDAQARTVFDVRLPGGVTALTFGDVYTDTVAVFGDATYDFNPMFSVSVGGRYTWDDRQSRVLRQTFLGGGSPFFSGQGTLFATTSDFRGAGSFSKFTPRASVSFKPTPDRNLYASYAKGFKGGGFDPRGVSTAAPISNPATGRTYQDIYNFLSFDPETVDTYEVGYKASLFDRRLTVALAAFHSDYTDVQVPGSVGTVLNGQQTFIGVTTNAGRAKIDGVEAEATAVLAKGLASDADRVTLQGTMGYLDARYTRFIDSRGIDVSDRRRFQNTPDWTASGTLAYAGPVAGGQLNVSTTVAYRGDSQQFELRTPLIDQPAYALWDANVTYDINEHLTVGVHGRNLTDKRYIVSGYNFLGQNPDTGDFLRNAAGNLVPTLGTEGVLTAYYGNPRQVFVTLTARY
ncbi:iron complex outermembrane recepter protein [Sphingomonas guangdongensis]|uniref:Iron complex outermembrane recepter protein n=1 Tax=Sphingomonas guangdongensis TaxID=1141890 RepID=A0A285QAS8_9SPHN|nr:TonB-dependent receptor [Sphingomonas guangdongensis]SOB78936.1 iron complex outermembrane recepter protein [Sphingomonas guangdongensis]